MKIILITVLSFVFSIYSFGQVSINSNLFWAKDWSKEISLYKGKEYVISELLQFDNTTMRFKIYPLAAANSGEMTTLVYECEEKKIEGLVLGFFGSFYNENGFLYTGYKFKNLPKEKALQMLIEIDRVFSDNKKFLDNDMENHNVTFKWDEMIFLIYSASPGQHKIRVFWEKFDSEWDIGAYLKTKKRLLKQLK